MPIIIVGRFLNNDILVFYSRTVKIPSASTWEATPGLGVSEESPRPAQSLGDQSPKEAWRGRGPSDAGSRSRCSPSCDGASGGSNSLSDPASPALLGLNVGGGIQVKLRLRRPKRDWDFFPFELVLDTMLHELCHIAHGPHNAQFYKLWDELRVECEELVSKGITGTGQGFEAPGKRLGWSTRQPLLSSLRQTAGAAAAKRARIGALLPSGPRRLGGDSEIMTALTPIQAAAMAAERRMQDDL